MKKKLYFFKTHHYKQFVFNISIINDIAFLLIFLKGFDFVKKMKTWVENSQKLSYVSPYENVFHLDSNSDQAEKWTVAILHELFSLLVSKKTERENLLFFRECLGWP